MINQNEEGVIVSLLQRNEEMICPQRRYKSNTLEVCLAVAHWVYSVHFDEELCSTDIADYLVQEDTTGTIHQMYESAK